MRGSFLRFYVGENEHHRGVLLWEWLLDQGNRLGIRGGSAFRAIGGFGRRHTVHEDHFFELAGSGSIEVEFVVTAEEEQGLLDLIRREKVRIFSPAFRPASASSIRTPKTCQARGVTTSPSGQRAVAGRRLGTRSSLHHSSRPCVASIGPDHGRSLAHG